MMTQKEIDALKKRCEMWKEANCAKSMKLHEKYVEIRNLKAKLADATAIANALKAENEALSDSIEQSTEMLESKTENDEYMASMMLGWMCALDSEEEDATGRVMRSLENTAKDLLGGQRELVKFKLRNDYPLTSKDREYLKKIL